MPASSCAAGSDPRDVLPPSDVNSCSTPLSFKIRDTIDPLNPRTWLSFSDFTILSVKGKLFFRSSATASPTHIIFVLTLPFLLRFPSYQSTAALRAKSTTSFLSLLVTESVPLQCWQYGLLHDPRHRWNRNGIAKSILNLRLFKTLQVKVVCALQSCVFQPGHPAHTYFPLADKHDSLLGGTAPGGTQAAGNIVFAHLPDRLSRSSTTICRPSNHFIRIPQMLKSLSLNTAQRIDECPTSLLVPPPKIGIS